MITYQGDIPGMCSCPKCGKPGTSNSDGDRYCGECELEYQRWRADEIEEIKAAYARLVASMSDDCGEDLPTWKEYLADHGW